LPDARWFLRDGPGDARLVPFALETKTLPTAIP
jgi:hypothetical protein